MLNPLVPDILSSLHAYPDGISEYDLLQVLGEHQGFSRLCESGQLAIFQRHFMVMNGLYQLQQQLWQEEQVYLEISPLLIQLGRRSATGESTQTLLAQSSTLASYYLDWNNYAGTSEQDVIDLIGNFWCRFVSDDDRHAAFEVLELEQEADQQTIMHRYRTLAARHHPDKGGDKDMFIRIRQAYEVLKVSD